MAYGRTIRRPLPGWRRYEYDERGDIYHAEFNIRAKVMNGEVRLADDTGRLRSVSCRLGEGNVPVLGEAERPPMD